MHLRRQPECLVCQGLNGRHGCSLRNFFYTFYTAKFYIMNQNWNRVDFGSVYSNLMKLLGDGSDTKL